MVPFSLRFSSSSQPRESSTATTYYTLLTGLSGIVALLCVQSICAQFHPLCVTAVDSALFEATRHTDHFSLFCVSTSEKTSFVCHGQLGSSQATLQWLPSCSLSKIDSPQEAFRYHHFSPHHLYSLYDSAPSQFQPIKFPQPMWLTCCAVLSVHYGN